MLEILQYVAILRVPAEKNMAPRVKTGISLTEQNGHTLTHSHTQTHWCRTCEDAALAYIHSTGVDNNRAYL